MDHNILSTRLLGVSIPSSFRRQYTPHKSYYVSNDCKQDNERYNESSIHLKSRLSSPGCYGYCTSDSGDDEDETVQWHDTVSDTVESPRKTGLKESQPETNHAINEFACSPSSSSSATTVSGAYTATSSVSRYIPPAISSMMVHGVVMENETLHNASMREYSSSDTADGFDSHPTILGSPQRTPLKLSSPSGGIGARSPLTPPPAVFASPRVDTTSSWPEFTKYKAFLSSVAKKAADFDESMGKFEEDCIDRMRQEEISQRARLRKLGEVEAAHRKSDKLREASLRFLVDMVSNNSTSPISLPKLKETLNTVLEDHKRRPLSENERTVVEHTEMLLKKCERLLISTEERNAELRIILAQDDLQLNDRLAEVCAFSKMVKDDSLLGRLRNGGEERVKQLDQAVTEAEKVCADLSKAKATKVSGGRNIDSNDFEFLEEPVPAYVREAIEHIEWLYSTCAPEEEKEDETILETVQECQERIRSLATLCPEERTSARLVDDICFMEKTLSAVVSGHQQNVIRGILSAVVGEVMRSDHEETVLMLGHIACAVCRMAGTVAGRTFHALVCNSCMWSIPFPVHTPIKNNIPRAKSPQERKRVVMLLACQMSSTGTPKYVDLKAGWTWVLRCGLLVSKFASRLGSSDSPSSATDKRYLREVCGCLRAFLRIAGETLVVTFGRQFVEMLSTIVEALPCTVLEAVSDPTHLEATDLRNMLTNIVRTHQIPCALFKGQDSHCIHAKVVIRSLAALKAEAERLSNDKSERMYTLSRQIGIKDRKALNQLGTEKSSQEKAVDNLCGKIIRAKDLDDDAMLRYTLYTIAKNCIVYCQTTSFVVKSVEPLAVVISGICTQFPNTSELFLMQFYASCPFTIPQLVADGGSGDEYKMSMGFTKKKSGDGAEVWESTDSWLKRMSNILAVYASVVAQPGDYPLSLDDGWRWLSRVVNFCLRLTSAPPQPTAKLLDIFLRAVAPAMTTVCKEYFIAVLNIIQQKIIPKLTEETDVLDAASHKKLLSDFVNRYISSNGCDCGML